MTGIQNTVLFHYMHLINYISTPTADEMSELKKKVNKNHREKLFQYVAVRQSTKQYCKCLLSPETGTRPICDVSTAARLLLLILKHNTSN